MRYLVLSIIFIVTTSCLSATTIIIYITAEFAIMAVDSKGAFTNAKTYQKTNKVVPKIYKTGNIFFSVAGLTANTARSFDVGKLTDANLKAGNSLNSGIDSIKLNVKDALLKYLTNQKKNNYNLFKKNIEEENYITSIGIIAIKNNKPYAHLIGFKVRDGATLKITVEEEFYASNFNKDAVYYLGTSAHIDEYMSTIKSNNLKPVAFVEQLMQLQMEKTPELVGPPIDIIKITAKETQWIRRKESTPVEL
jgi:hypothetical protein